MEEEAVALFLMALGSTSDEEGELVSVEGKEQWI